MSMLRLASTVVLTGLLPWACVDPPITVILPPEAGIRAPPDSSVEGGFDLTACRSCVAAPDMPGPGCGSAYSACEGDSKCKAMIACAFESGWPSPATIRRCRWLRASSNAWSTAHAWRAASRNDGAASTKGSLTGWALPRAPGLRPIPRCRAAG